jgi:hypothetical protein
MLENPGRLTYPGMIVPRVKSKGELGGKELEVLLPDLTIEERIGKYFEFCRAFDERKDPVLRDHFQQHSHRLHWHEHPYVDVINTVKDLETRIWLTLLFSFTNEHWGTFMTAVEGGERALINRFSDEKVRHARSDLFQIYYPKGTKVKQWLISGTRRAAKDMVKTIGGRNSRWGMMNVAYIMAEYLCENQGFRTALYPCKNFSRYMAMGDPNLINPESYIHPGTGSFRGLHQIFGGKYLMGSAKYKVTEEGGEYVPLNADGIELHHQMYTLSNHRDNPVRVMNSINHEDKACFFFKRLAYEAGVQKATARIPYTWIFPADWNLKTGKYDRDPSTPEYQI